MANIFFVSSLLTMSSTLFAFTPSPVSKEKINLIAKVEIKETKYLTLITTSDDQAMLLYRLPTDALDETTPRVVINRKPTPLDKAFGLNSQDTSKLGKLAVLACSGDFKILIGAQFSNRVVTVLDIKKAKLETFDCTGYDECPIKDTAWLSNFDNDAYTIALNYQNQDEFVKMMLGYRKIKVFEKAFLCTENGMSFFSIHRCKEPHGFGADIQGFFTAKNFYILDRSNHQINSFPTKAFSTAGSKFKIKITKFSDFFVISDEKPTTNSTQKPSETEASSTVLKTTTEKSSTTTIIIIIVSAIIAVTLLIILIITIVCCCCTDKSKKKKKKASSKKSSSGTPRKKSKGRHSSARKSRDKRKNSGSRRKSSKRSFKKENKRKDSKRKGSRRKGSKGRKFTKSSSKANSKADRKRTSASKTRSDLSGLSKRSSPLSSRYFSSN